MGGGVCWGMVFYVLQYVVVGEGMGECVGGWFFMCYVVVGEVVGECVGGFFFMCYVVVGEGMGECVGGWFFMCYKVVGEVVGECVGGWFFMCYMVVGEGMGECVGGWYVLKISVYWKNYQHIITFFFLSPALRTTGGRIISLDPRYPLPLFEIPLATMNLKQQQMVRFYSY